MLTCARFAQGLAFGKKIKRMVQYFKIQHFFSTSLYLHDPWIAKLKYFFAIGADQMIVLPVFIGLFKLGHVLAKLMFNYQSGIQQNLYVIVQSGSAYPVFFVLHH